jgi:hypothetical protein
MRRTSGTVGKFLLIRPDRSDLEHAESHPAGPADAALRARVVRRGKWQSNDLPKSWRIKYGELLQVRPMNFSIREYFPEQAVNWDYIACRFAAQDGR